ncbi:MAG: hypothetical protein K2X81_07610, partial [Candidatus Obscuribacterales bacterium]|nr:hypothetical protein [Candidatus Obscuribacterales bacterium]
TPETQNLLRLIDDAKANGDLAPNFIDELKVVSNECAMNPELYAAMQKELQRRGVKFSIDDGCATFQRSEFHGFYSYDFSLKVPLDGSAATGSDSVRTGSSTERKAEELDKDIAAKVIFAPPKRTSIFID